jgi:hypothetical protein
MAHAGMLTVSPGMGSPGRSLAAALYCLLRICSLATDVVPLSVCDHCLEMYVVSEPFASNGYFCGSTVPASSKCATLLISDTAIKCTGE